MTPELLVFAWLRFVKRLPLVLFERTPRRLLSSRPDVVGVTQARYLTEVEVKRTLADFRANQRKRYIQQRELWLKHWPRAFYYAVPSHLVAKVLPELPSYAGLLSWNEDKPRFEYIGVEREAEVNRLSHRLTVREATQLVHLQSNQLWAAEARAAEWRQRRTGENAEYII